VKLSPGLAETIIVHAREEFPNECCGLIAGKNGVATRVLPATNAEGTPFMYVMASHIVPYSSAESKLSPSQVLPVVTMDSG
jgi:proteasome lid subunit RPN8/RPN11